MLANLADALSDALERETVALRQGDYDAAARLAADKLAALQAFTEAAAEPPAALATRPPATPTRPGSATCWSFFDCSE